MRRIIEIGGHSVFAPGLKAGGWALDAGANRGNFGAEVAARFPVDVIYVEANPGLATSLRDKGRKVFECALGAVDGPLTFNIGENDEASSLRTPAGERAHLVVRNSVQVLGKSLATLSAEAGITCFDCIKLDIEGSEIDVLASAAVATMAKQWTVEFHDDAAFKMCARAEVDAAIARMREAGFSVLIRDWPSRTNVLFVNRRALAIGAVEWLGVKLRYQFVAWLWRLARRIRAR